MKITTLDNTVYYLLLCYALFSSTFKEIGAGFLYIATLCAIIRHVKQPLLFTVDQKLKRAIILFFLTGFLSIPFSAQPFGGIGELVTLLLRMVLPFILVIGFIKQRRQLFSILIAMVISLFIADVYAIWQGVHGNYRALAFSEHPMTLAGYLLQMIPLILIFFVDDREISKRWRIVFGMILIFSTVALVYNGTRGAWIAVILTLLFYGLLNIKKKPKILLGLLALFMIVGIIVFHSPSLKHRIDTIDDNNFQSNAERLLIWHSAWNMFLGHPITGVGLGNYEKAYKEQYISPKAKEPKLSHAHNNFLQVLADRGFVGFLGFTYLFGYILFYAYTCYSKRKDLWGLAIFLVTISLLLQGFTEYNAGNSAVTRMYWFLLGLSCSGINLGLLAKKDELCK